MASVSRPTERPIMTNPTTPTSGAADLPEAGCSKHHLIHCSQCRHDNMVRDLRAENDRLTTQLAALAAGQATAAQQPGAAGLIGALKDAQQAINSMKVEAETASQGDEQMMLEACETISNEGLQADTAIRVALASAPAQPASQQEPSHTAVRLAELVLSDCGHSSNYTPLLDRVAARIDAHVEQRLDELRVCLESKLAPSPAAQGDAMDAARYRAFIECGQPICFMGEEYYGKAALDAAIDAAMNKGGA